MTIDHLPPEQDCEGGCALIAALALLIFTAAVCLVAAGIL